MGNIVTFSTVFGGTPAQTRAVRGMPGLRVTRAEARAGTAARRARGVRMTARGPGG